MDQRRHTLLVVDDEPDVLESLRHLFHRTYRVLTAGGGDQALTLLEQNEVHLILSDQRMPGMSGDVLLSHARRLQPDAIRMLFTGYADIQAVINAVNEGNIFRYILKPWDASELEGILRQAIDHYELIAERKRLISELKSANQQLTQANHDLEEAGQLKSAFIEVASHEFNTPITLILGLSELLRLTNPDRNEHERTLIERISASAKQLAKLVTNTLTVMRADDFRRTLQCQPTDLDALLVENLERIRPFAEARQLVLRLQIAEELGLFDVDVDKLSAAVINLLTNAIKFTPDGGELTLSARLSSADEAEIQIKDLGIGISPRELAHLFQPFFTQFDSSRHSSGDFGFNKRGLGLGLSIVKQFVELHGGQVEAESRLNEGTTFTIRLPRRQPLVPMHDQSESRGEESDSLHPGAADSADR